MNQSGELEDDELDSVAGGGCFSIDVERLKVDPYDKCRYGYYRRCMECKYYDNFHCYN